MNTNVFRFLLSNNFEKKMTNEFFYYKKFNEEYSTFSMSNCFFLTFFLFIKKLCWLFWINFKTWLKKWVQGYLIESISTLK